MNKKYEKYIIFVLIIVFTISAIFLYGHYFNQGSGVRIGHMESTESGSWLRQVSFHHYGTGVYVYLVYYHDAERVSHERLTYIESDANSTFEGRVVWDSEFERNRSGGYPAIVLSDRKVENLFEFSNINFVVRSARIPHFTQEEIENEQRYILHVWLSGGAARGDGDFFHPDQLTLNEHTAILYVVFR